MSASYDDALLNAVQASEELAVDLTYDKNPVLKDEDLLGRPREENVGSKKEFNVFAIISAGLIFITIISWFEIGRLYMEYLTANDKPSKSVLHDRTIGQIYYAIGATFLVVVVLYIFRMKELV
jgi:hypothetical protein